MPSVDIICMGSPCRDLSLAGKREGLKGERSGLFREATRIIREMRRATDGKYPRFVVWENVPGAFSSNKGNDFRVVLEEIGQAEVPTPPNGKWAKAGVAELPQCEIAWRTLDAQYWGVPQPGGDIGGGSENLCCQSFVRRLTPTECERLQGLPDGYTLIDDKSCCDSARYKALGNGMAKPCSDYVLRRLAEAFERE